MNKQPETPKNVFSPGFLILIAVCAYFVLAVYDVFVSVNFAGYLIQNFPMLSGLMKMPWWTATFYSSELGGGVGSTLRLAASILAVYSAFFYWRKKDSAIPQIKRKVAAALALEAGYFLLFIPSVWLGFVFPTTGGKVWYFEVTPVPEVFFVAGVACLAMVLAIPPLLFKLRSLVVHNAHKSDLIRWSSITALAYLFVVFWFNSTMQWTGMISTWGTSMVLEPLNMAGFASSVFGLFLIAVFAFAVAYPVIKEHSSPAESETRWRCQRRFRRVLHLRHTRLLHRRRLQRKPFGLVRDDCTSQSLLMVCNFSLHRNTTTADTSKELGAQIHHLSFFIKDEFSYL